MALGKLTIIAGDPGLGKSQLTLDLAARVTRGDRWPVDGTQAPIGSALIVSAEDAPDDTIVPRLMAANADLSKIQIVEHVADNQSSTNVPIDRELSLQRDTALLEDKIAAMGDCRLVIVDPISAFMGTTDTHDPFPHHAHYSSEAGHREQLQVLSPGRDLAIPS